MRLSLSLFRFVPAIVSPPIISPFVSTFPYAFPSIHVGKNVFDERKRKKEKEEGETSVEHELSDLGRRIARICACVGAQSTENASVGSLR